MTLCCSMYEDGQQQKQNHVCQPIVFSISQPRGKMVRGFCLKKKTVTSDFLVELEEAHGVGSQVHIGFLFSQLIDF